MAGESAGPPLREFVGFVWQGDVPGRRDFRVWAADLAEARALVTAEYGEDFRVSLWNEDDAKKIR